MAKFTPGPWYSDIFGNVTTHPPHKGLKGFLPTTGIIAKCYKHPADENAHLIAAAPDLYAACEMAIEATGGSEHWQGETKKFLLAIEAALEKAGGEA